MDHQLHLDQGESATFLRQLEDIDTKVYQRRYPDLLARSVVKTFVSVASWASSHTWREVDFVSGRAKIVTDHGDDYPSVDLTAKENNQVIKDLGNSYGYTIKEIKQAQATGMPLDSLRAQTSRRDMEQLIDDLLAFGDSLYGLNGVLKLDATQIAAANRVGTYILSTKQAGGTSWGTFAVPKATGQEMANDVIGMCSDRVSATKGIWQSFDVFMPIDQFNLMQATRLNPLTDRTSYEFAAANKFVRSITPWYKCAGAGASSADRMMILPAGDSEVLAGIVPQEWTPSMPQLRNQRYVINASASCGGVICRYPLAVRYADGL